MITQIYDVNLIPSNLIMLVRCSQYDAGLRTLVFNLYDGDSRFNAYGMTARISGTKPDKTGFMYDMTVDGSQVSIVITEQMTAVAGPTVCEITVYDGNGGRVSTVNFILQVERSALAGTEISETEIPLLQEAIDASATVISLSETFGSPLVAQTAAEMTLTNRVYVYTGSESGYTAGNWYYYNGSAWVSGGVYQSAAVAVDSALSTTSQNPVQNKVITEEITDLKNDLNDLEDNLSDNVYKSNVLFSGTVVATGTGEYVNTTVLSIDTVSAGDSYTFSADSVVGATESKPIRTLLRRDTTLVRVVNDALESVLTVTQADINNGANNILFLFYPATGTALPIGEAKAVGTKIIETSGNPCVLQAPMINAIRNQSMNDVISDVAEVKNGLDEYIYRTNILFKGDVEASGNGVYVYNDCFSVENISKGDAFIFSAESVTGATETKPIRILLRHGSTQVRAVNGSLSATVTITQSDITNNVDNVVFRFYAATGTALPSGTALATGVSVTKSSENTVIIQEPLKEAIREEVMGDVIGNLSSLITDNTVLSIAHRGDNTLAPQNTKAAYILARKGGFTSCENDLAITHDGRFVMYHDVTLSKLGDMVDLNGYLVYTNGTLFYFYDSVNAVLYDENYSTSSVDVSTLTRCNGSNYVLADLDFDFLRKLSFGAYFGNQFLTQKILTFGEWILLCKQIGTDGVIDKKIAYDNSIIDDLFDTVQSYGMKDHITWTGLSHDQALYLRTKDPDAAFKILSDSLDTDLLTTWSDLKNTGRGVRIEYDGKTVTENTIKTTLEYGFKATAYFVDIYLLTETQILERISELVEYGINELTCDHYKVSDAFASMLNEF